MKSSGDGTDEQSTGGAGWAVVYVDSLTKGTSIGGYAEGDTPYPNLKRLGETPLTSHSPRNAWERELFARLDRVRNSCGELCTINDLAALQRYTVQPWNQSAVSMRQLKVPVDCYAIMSEDGIDASDNTIPGQPPPELLPYYTMNGLSGFSLRHINQTYLGNEAAIPLWDEGTFSSLLDKIKRYKNGRIATYGDQSRFFLIRIMNYIPMKGKRVLVIGTEYPWVEACALYLGAAHVVTLEYGRIKSQHPKVSTLLPSEFRDMFLNKTLEFFDVILSFSSVEHSGLGRYGDALNPWGDVLAIARARCVTKPGGYLGLSVPAGGMGDYIRFNEMRSFGEFRYPLLTANWEQLDGQEHRVPSKKRHPTYVFRNPSI